MYHKKRTAHNSYFIPPAWCSQICQNAMNDICVERCAPKRNASGFQVIRGLNIEDLPPFPHTAWQEEMSGHERQAAAGVYLKAVVDHLQGIRHEPPIRPYSYRSRNGRISEAVQAGGAFGDVTKVSSQHSNGDKP
ncbi:MAG: hypothetical protein P8183_15865 [Anaerolineae bacterium]